MLSCNENRVPFVSIIIINYNGERFLESCLRSIFSIDYPSFEVILVDNGSSDNSINIARKMFSGVKIVELKEITRYT